MPIMTGLAIAGFGLSLASTFGGAGNSASSRILQGKSDKLNAEIAVLETGVKIEQTKADISAYDSFLSAFPNYAELQRNTFEAQSKGEFRGLLNNFAMGNVGAGASGRAGGSFGMMVQEAQNDLIDFAGADMQLGGGDGGRYQMAGSELNNNLTMQEQQARTQRDILGTSLGTLGEVKGLYEKAVGNANESIKDARHAKKTWWNPFD